MKTTFLGPGKFEETLETLSWQAEASGLAARKGH